MISPKSRLLGLLPVIQAACAMSILAIAGCSSEKAPAPAAGNVTVPAALAEVVELPAGSFAAAWHAEVPLGSAKVKGVFVNDETVFVYATDHRCFWLDRGSGRLKHVSVIAPPHDTLFPPVTLKDRVVFPSTTQLSVHERATGKLIHIDDLPYSASSAAAGTIDGSLLYINVESRNGGRLLALETAPKVGLTAAKRIPYELTPKWELLTRGQMSAGPAVMGEQVYVGSRDGGVYAVRIDNRDILWPGLPEGFFRTGGEILANISVDAVGVYVASMDSKVYRLDPATGRVKWVFHAERGLREDSAPVPTRNDVLVYVPDRGLVAIDKAGSGEIRKGRWTLPEGRQILSADDKYVYVRTDKNAILALDKASGEVKFGSQRGDYGSFASNLSDKDNNIYAATSTGIVYRIKPVLKPGTVGELVLAPSLIPLASN